jgi:hypothetical protein
MKAIQRKLWAIIVAYMLGLHNFYRGDDKTPDNMVIKIEHQEREEEGKLKDGF